MKTEVYFEGKTFTPIEPTDLETLRGLFSDLEILAAKKIPQTRNLAGRLNDSSVKERRIVVSFPRPYHTDQSLKYTVRDYAIANDDEGLANGLILIGDAIYTSEYLRRAPGGNVTG